MTAKIDHWDEMEGQLWKGSTQIIIPALRVAKDTLNEPQCYHEYWSRIPPGQDKALTFGSSDFLVLELLLPLFQTRIPDI